MLASRKGPVEPAKTLFQSEGKSFCGRETGRNPGPETLVIKTYITDETPSNVPLNWVELLLLGSIDVGNVALYSEIFMGDRRVGAASGAHDGRIILEGYTKWGVVEHALKKWLAGMRQYFLIEIPDRSD